jgi:protein phosphatase
MKVRVGARTDVGRVRERNEDAYLVRQPVYAVADGMGGHRGGDVASALAVETLKEADATIQEPADSLAEMIRKANLRVLERGESDRRLQGMGTTLTALVTEDGKGHVVHVGDSRAYLLRDGALQQLTEDHTLVQRMVREGRLTPEEARDHPQRSIVTRALGVEEELELDRLTLDLHVGDRLLLCTDGLTGKLSQEEIREILGREEAPRAACDALVEAANRAGGDDNITVVVLDVMEVGDAGSGEDAGALDASGSTRSGESPVGSSRPGSTQASLSHEPRSASVTATAAPPDVETETDARGHRLNRRRVAAWASVLIVVLVAAVIGGRIFLHHQWYVGEAGGRVAVYNGIPATVVFKLSHVRELTDLSAAQVEQCRQYSGLRSGITANNLADARAIVAQMRSDVPCGRGGG